jgi:leukotriene-A4 hydrolase
MYQDMLDYGLTSNYSSLTPKAGKDNNPDDAFSTIPYEKGFQFLHYLETLVGEENMQEFLRDYLKDFQKTSIKAIDMQSEFEQHVYYWYSSKDAKKIIAKIDWHEWLEGPGLPPVTADFSTPDLDKMYLWANLYKQGITPEGYETWPSLFVNQKAIFLAELVENRNTIDAATVEKIDNELHVSEEKNGELLYLWYQLTIASGYHSQAKDGFKAEEDFVAKNGRMKFCVPVYKALWAKDREAAQRIFATHRDFYHPIALDAIEASFKGLPQPKLPKFVWA